MTQMRCYRQLLSMAALIAGLGGYVTSQAQSQSKTQTAKPTMTTPQTITIANQVTGQNIVDQLNPQAQQVIRIAIDQGPFPDDIAGKRKAFNALFARLSGTPEAIQSVSDKAIPVKGGTIPLRIYRPKAGQLPVMVYYHGGGFNKGDLQSHDVALRALANRTGVVVVAVDYRRTPEHQYPTQINDAYTALQWVAAHADELDVDVSRLAVGGDSVGGNLAAVTALRARDEKGPTIGFQLLFYPVTDVTLSSNSTR